mgnify:CR=1 FL=1
MGTGFRSTSRVGGRRVNTRLLMTLITLAPLHSAGVDSAPQNGVKATEGKKTLAQRLTESLVREVSLRASSVPKVLRTYNEIERRERFDLETRYELHTKLIVAICAHKSRSMRSAAAKVLRRPTKSRTASQVLMLQAIAHPDFPAPRILRVKWFLRYVKSSYAPFMTWGLRLMGDTGWGESIEAMLALLEVEEEGGRSGSLLWHLVSGELYRVLGGKSHRGTVQSIRKQWDELGRTVPETPDYGLSDRRRSHRQRPQGRSRATSVFFGDKISPLSVLLIDRSSSMRHKVVLERIWANEESPSGESETGLAEKPQPKNQEPKNKKSDSEKAEQREESGAAKAHTERTNDSGTIDKQSKPDDERPKPKPGAPDTRLLPKMEIVRTQLMRAIESLQKHFRFNLVSYDAEDVAWKVDSEGTLSLHEADSENLSSAIDFARDLTIGRGTNIYAALDAALRVPEVDTVYLLSDGEPSQGGGVPEIEKNVKLLNYLRGIRIVTYGFTPGEKGKFDEEFMKRLAANNWGWYRRLNER